MKLSKPHPYDKQVPQATSIACMTKHQGCIYEGTWYNMGEGRNVTKGICGNCIGGNLFYENPIRVHEQCLAPFSKIEFTYQGTTYKYCVHLSTNLVHVCDAETQCENMDSHLALLEEFPHRSMLIHFTSLRAGGIS